MMAWDLGMKMLRINMQALIGIDAGRVFFQMNANHDNSVSWKEWKDFFKDVRKEELERIAETDGGGKFEDRAKRVKQNMLQRVKERAAGRKLLNKSTTADV